MCHEFLLSVRTNVLVLLAVLGTSSKSTKNWVSHHAYIPNFCCKCFTPTYQTAALTKHDATNSQFWAMGEGTVNVIQGRRESTSGHGISSTASSLRSRVEATHDGQPKNHRDPKTHILKIMSQSSVHSNIARDTSDSH